MRNQAKYFVLNTKPLNQTEANRDFGPLELIVLLDTACEIMCLES